MNLFKESTEQMLDSPVEITPSATTLLKDITDRDFRALLAAGYSSRDTPRRVATSVVNAIYTGKFYVCILTRDMIEDICKKDCNLEPKKRTLGAKENYPKVLAAMYRIYLIGIFIKGENRKPQVMKVEHRGLLHVMGEDLALERTNSQYELCIDYRNKIEDTNKARKRKNKGRFANSDDESDDETDDESDGTVFCIL